MGKGLLLLLLTGGGLITPSVNAGFIAIDIRVEAAVEDKKLKASIEVTNNGNEPAYNVDVNADLKGQVFSIPLKNVLNAKEKVTGELVLEVAVDKPGLYPLIITVNSTDANQYPLSAVSVVHFSYQEKIIPRVFGSLTNSEISNKGKVVFRLKNLDSRNKKVNIRLIIPRELSVYPLQKPITLMAFSEKNLEFQITNFSALEGSVYPIYAIMEYEQNNRHYSTSAIGNVKIGAPKGGFIKSNRELLIGVIVVLVCIFIYANHKAHKSSINKDV